MVKFRKTRRPPLVIHCAEHNPQQLRWYYQQDDGRLYSGCVQTSLPATAPRQARLLLPASQIIFHQAAHMTTQPQTLSWQLEPLALTDPEALHTVIVQRDAQFIHFAAIDRSWLQQALTAARTLGVSVTHALPDVLAVAENQALPLQGRWLIRHQRWRGLSLTPDQLAALSEQDSALAATLTEQQHQLLAETLPTPPSAHAVATDSTTEAIVSFLRRACQQQVNFLQGEFTVRRPLQRARIFALTCALCSVLLLFAAPLWSGWQASQSAYRLQQQSLALYQRFFPGEQPAHPAAALARQLDAWQQTPPAAGPMHLLAESAAVLASLKDNALQTLYWDQQQHQLHLSFATPLPPEMRHASNLTIRTEGNLMIIGRTP